MARSQVRNQLVPKISYAYQYYSRLPSATLPFTQRGMFDFVPQTVGKLITGAKMDFFFQVSKPL